MTFKEIISRYKNQTEAELEKFLSQREAEAEKYGDFGKNAVANIKEYVLRGRAKRIRGALVCLGYKAFTGEDNPEIFKIAAASELAHAYFLMHDDIIDRDDMRRGGDAIHFHYKKLAEKENFKTESGHFGNSIAVVIGDICAGFSYGAIMGSPFEDSRKLKAINCFNEMIIQTCHGQLLDVVGAENKNFSEKDILEIYLYKTARYTIEAPLQIGAILAGAGEEQLALIGEYSRPLGMVFQLVNDLGEIFVKEGDIDAKTACDISEGKQPLFIIKALQNGNEYQKNFIGGLLGKNDISGKELEELKQILRGTGALDYCKKFASEKILEAKNALEKISFADESAREFLEDFTVYFSEEMEGMSKILKIGGGGGI